MQPRMLGEDIALEIRCMADKLPHIEAYTGMIEQIVMNPGGQCARGHAPEGRQIYHHDFRR